MNNQYPGSTAEISCQVENSVARIKIKRPDRKNAVTGAMWVTLAELFENLGADKAIRVAAISGEGADFCAGADIAEFDAMRADSTTAKAYEEGNSRAFAAIRNCSIPVIAAIRGICFGGGFGIAAACDLRIATRDARFSVPAAKLGLAYPQDAMIDIVDAAGTQMARYLTYSGARISADEALSIGFLAKVHENNNFELEIDSLLQKIAANAPLSVRASKASIDAVVHGGEERIENARKLGSITFDSDDYAEGRMAFREKRRPDFRGE